MDTSIPFAVEQNTVLFIIAFCIIYLLIHSDVFHEQILSKIDGATQGNYSTTWGQMIQMMATLGGIIVAVMVI